VVSNFIVQALTGEPITLYGEGEQTRSFCYVDDMVAAFLCLMESPEDFTGPVNLGNPNECTISQLAQTVIALTASASAIERRPLPQDDPVRRRPDISLAQRVLDWAPQVELAEGLGRTVEYFRRALGTAGEPRRPRLVAGSPSRG
jgi:UDP-glucuronate decarboxylase